MGEHHDASRILQRIDRPGPHQQSDVAWCDHRRDRSRPVAVFPVIALLILALVVVIGGAIHSIFKGNKEDPW